MLPINFQISWTFGLREEGKIDFQNGHHDGHLGFPIRTILAVFDLQVTLMFPTKFRQFAFWFRRKSEK